MQKKRKSVLACLTASLLLMQSSDFPFPRVSAENEAAQPAAAETAEDSADADASAAADSTWTDRSEADILSRMKCTAENDNLALYIPDKEQLGEGEKAEDIFALKNKKSGYIWWSSPINAGGDKIASKILCKELQSSLVITSAEPDSRSTSDTRSADTTKCTVTVAETAKGVTVTYNFKKLGIKIPVKYALGEDFLEVTVDTSKITEKYLRDSGEDKFIVTHSLRLLNAFGAADSEETGSFLIPDGAGAAIHFNNQKYTSKTYSQLIYGADTTAVPKTKGPTVEGVSLPMYAVCKGENAMLAVAKSGDGNCILRADVSGKGQSNTSYNRCGFEFILRSQDSYYLGGDSLNPLTIYENDMEQVDIAVRYYPLCAADEINADHSKNVEYTDIAARYRQYLTAEMNVKETAKADDSALYAAIYCGCEKQKNILGFPVFMKTAMTTYDEAAQILKDLKNAGADSLTVTLNNWTDAGISGKADFAAKPSRTLGGKSDFKNLTDYMAGEGIDWYPVVNNAAYYSGNGYFSLTDTAVRVSGSFARIVDYERAYGVPYGEKKTMSLLSPKEFPALYEKLTANYKKAGLKSACIGDLSFMLYGDYGKKSRTLRETTKENLSNAVQNLKKELGSVLAEHPNAYLLSSADCITDLPLSSSGFNIFDEEVPFYQMVMHGVTPYATKTVNGSADADTLVLMAAATGSNLRFDFLSADISELKDTDYDVFFYAHAAYWTETAAQYYRFLRGITEAASDAHMVSYTADGGRITTKYDNGTETIVDLDAKSVTLNGETRYLKDYVTEGGAAAE